MTSDAPPNRNTHERSYHAYIGVCRFVGPEWIEKLRAVTDSYVERSRALSTDAVPAGFPGATADPEDFFVLEMGHTPEAPRLTRLTSPADLHETYWEFAAGPVYQTCCCLQVVCGVWCMVWRGACCLLLRLAVCPTLPGTAAGGGYRGGPARAGYQVPSQQAQLQMVRRAATLLRGRCCAIKFRCRAGPSRPRMRSSGTRTSSSGRIQTS